MKIAFFIVKHIGMGGGIEKYTQELGTRLVAKGHEVTVYSMKHYADTPVEFEGMRVIGVPSLPFRATEKMSASAAAAIYSLFRNRPDIMHFHSVASGAFAWMSRLRKLPCVLQMHGLEWKRSSWGKGGASVLRILEKYSLKQATICTAVSNVQCEHFAKHYGVKMAFIPTGAEVKDKMPAKEIYDLGLKPKKYILFASRLVKEKGAHYLIPAFRRLKTDCKLIIAGDAKGEDEYKKELLGLAGDDPRIIFPGFVQGRLLEELFSNALIYTQPSEIEGLSIALLEGMSYGNTCLVSDIPENQEALESNGYYFKNKNADDYSDKLDWLLNNSSEAQQMGVKARERVKHYFSWDHITDQFEQLYEQVLAKPAPEVLLEDTVPAKPEPILGKRIDQPSDVSHKRETVSHSRVS